MRHLTVRVAWHDHGWDARICAAPSRNSFCLDLDRIREERVDAAEDALAGRLLSELTQQSAPAVRRRGDTVHERDRVDADVPPSVRPHQLDHDHARSPRPDADHPPAVLDVRGAVRVDAGPSAAEHRGAPGRPAGPGAQPSCHSRASGCSTAGGSVQLLEHVFGQLDVATAHWS